ncbi:MAG: hypothetical protein MUP55_01905, partial [Candidatus Aenigmarchaeota archaeon]|nr:hypothetical protein [Candidatus Aenigmarchaeota archaeon]
MQISGSNVILTEWINGIQTRGPITGPGQNTNSFNNIIFSGWENSGANFAGDHYIDDMVVADSYIGPMGDGGDTQPPTIQITSPTSNPTYSASSSPVTVGGTASDNVSVTQVTWSNNRGGSGTASGTTSWSVSGVTLQSGDNILTVTARDAAGNTGTDTLNVTYTAPDTTPPTRSGGSPSGTLPAGTTQATLSLSTNEPATCKYSTTPNTPYSSMTSTFSGAGTTSHTAQVSGLSNGQTYNYYVRCNDTSGNYNTNDFAITFSVANPPVCGNNIKEGSEVCDGTDLAGQNCTSRGFTGGTLSCFANCSGFNTSLCTSPLPCIDNDGDGYGNPASSSCTYPQVDCNDSNPNIHSGAQETCGDGIDYDCDGQDSNGYNLGAQCGGGTTNLALGKSATASRSDWGSSPSSVVDGAWDTEASRWTATGLQWVQIDLGSDYQISRTGVRPYG